MAKPPRLGDTLIVLWPLNNALATLPPGRYLVAVSGGADSTALARLAAADDRHAIVLAHLNHQLRGDESDADEAFVHSLATQLARPIVVGRLSDFLSSPPPSANPSARYRAARLAFFGQAVSTHALDGVLLAHHADDQTESVLLRILRGARLASLGGMTPRQRIGGLDIYRPLLDVRRDALRGYLQSIGQPWREDTSNVSPAYRRNIVRKWLAREPTLVDPLLALAAAAREWQAALEHRSSPLPPSFDCEALRLPAALADHAAGRWLIDHGAPPDSVSPATRRRLIDQALLPAAPPRQSYPGGILVRRRKKRIEVIAAPPIRSGALQSRQHHGKDQAAPAGEL